MDYSCDKFGDCSVVLAVLVLLCGQTDIYRHTQTDERFTPTTLVSVSNKMMMMMMMMIIIIIIIIIII